MEHDTNLHLTFGDSKPGNRQGDGIKGAKRKRKKHKKKKQVGDISCTIVEEELSSTWPYFTTRIMLPLVFWYECECM
jgi:hypothetical protein